MRSFFDRNQRAADVRVYRVTVRGKFGSLDEATRAYLTREQPEHDIFKSAYTAEGTFTYDERIHFFNLRYEIRCVGESDDPESLARQEAELFLRTLKIPHEITKVSVVDTSAMWSE